MPFELLGAAIRACLYDLSSVVTYAAAFYGRAWKRPLDLFLTGADMVVAGLIELDPALAAPRGG